MKVITCPEEYERQPNDIFCFLAGGVTNCWEWREEVIAEIMKLTSGCSNKQELILFNPKRADFKPEDSEKQILWEFKYLNDMDIFSMYFCNSPSLQPICMYELGRYLEVMKQKSEYYSKYFDFESVFNRIVISVEPGYSRSMDVILQTNLALDNKIMRNSTNDIPRISFVTTSPRRHAAEIFDCYQYLCNIGWRDVG